MHGVTVGGSLVMSVLAVSGLGLRARHELQRRRLAMGLKRGLVISIGTAYFGSTCDEWLASPLAFEQPVSIGDTSNAGLHSHGDGADSRPPVRCFEVGLHATVGKFFQ